MAVTGRTNVLLKRLRNFSRVRQRPNRCQLRPGYGKYGKYGAYGKYGSYGTYKRAVEEAAELDAREAEAEAMPVPAGYGKYGKYGKYGSYGKYSSLDGPLLLACWRLGSLSRPETE